MLAVPEISASEPAAAAEATYTITSQTLPVYSMVVSPLTSDTIEVYYINGSDVPYIEVEDWVTLQKQVIKYSLIPGAYELTLTKDGDYVHVTRDNGTGLTVNFKTGIMKFDDYNGFMMVGDSKLLDIIILPRRDEDGNPLYLKTMDSSVRKHGRNKTMDLGYYDIELVHQGDSYFLPLQTLSDIFMSFYGKTVIYNG